MSINQNKSVQFSGRTLLVFAVSNSLRVNLRITEVQAQEISKLAERLAPTKQESTQQVVTPLEENYYIGVYPKMAVCTAVQDGGPIPTADEMLDNSDVDQTNEWYMAVRDVNPWLFPPEVPEQTTAQIEVAEETVKKKRTRSRRVIHPSA